ncbi:hypothetical protein [Neisseria sp.]|uniref:hypothetical protein n=1 Tax=Neisseria sp. TaxID=192066 RepID=UPI0035A06122
MKLQNHTEPGSEYFRYHTVQKVRFDIPFAVYRELEKKVYRSPKYWINDISQTTLWMCSSIIKCQLSAFLMCLFLAADAGISVSDGESLWSIFHIAQPVGWVLFLTFLLFCAVFGSRPFDGSVFYRHMGSLLEQEYADKVIPAVELPAEKT